jgi:DNA invertase Pin-like site-specific DNA recombinase
MSPKIKPNKVETYIVYLRASRESQRDGLGIQVQRTAIDSCIERFGGKILQEVEEIISGGKSDREGLNTVIDLAKGTGSKILIHKIDRFSREGFPFMARLEENNVSYVEAVAPNDSNFSKAIKFVAAKEERDRTKERVSDALTEIKKKIEVNGYHISKAGNKITHLGKPQNLTQKGRDKSLKVRRDKALNNPNNKRAIAVVKLLYHVSLNKMSKYFNENGFLTSTGKEFTPTAVSNLRKLYKI